MTTTEQTFGEAHFGTADLGHKKRNRCLIKIADLVHRHPGGTLPEKLHSPKDYKAMTRLVNRAEVTHETVLRPHCQRTQGLMRQVQGTVLILHDTTELDYSGLHSIKDLGSIGGDLGRGYQCHNSLAYDWQNREVIGLANQILHKRRLVGRKEPVAKKRQRRDRESRLWVDAVAAVEAGSATALAAAANEPATATAATEKTGPDKAGPDKALPDSRWVHVADRGSDTFEHLAQHDAKGTLFLIRTPGQRIIQPGHETLGPRQNLNHYAKSLPLQGKKKIRIGGRHGVAERSTEVGIAFSPVTVHPPHVKRGEYEKRPLRLWLVVVRELNPPPGTEPVCWVLLTNVAVGSLADAWERCDWYVARWVIEEYHKGQKTGCSVEDMQFTSSQALKPMIALLSVVAVTLLNLRDASRDETKAQRPAVDYVAPIYVAVLSVWRHKEQRPDMTVREFYLALARLGGHMNRKNDRPPGWLVLWKGWMALQTKVETAEDFGFKIRG